MDVRLITILPPNTVSQATNAPATTTQGASIQAQIPTGSVLSGFILNRDATGNPILRTPSGDVVFSSNIFLKIGSEVVIRIQNTAGTQSAHILSVNGQSPEIAQTQSAFSREGNVSFQTPTPAAPTSGAPNSPPPALGSNLNAVVVIPPAPIRIQQASTPQNNPLAPGTNLLLSLLSINPPAGSNNPALSQLGGEQTPTPSALNTLLPQAQQSATATVAATIESLLATPGEEAPAATAPAPPTPPTPAASTPQPATTTSQTPNQLPNNSTAQPTLTPTQSAPFTASNQQAARAELPSALAQTVIASVSTIADDGSVTVDSALGYLRIPNAAGLRVGDQIAVRVGSVGNANSYTVMVANNAPTPPLTPIINLAKEWPAMQQLVQILTASGDVSLLQNLPQISLTPNTAGTATQLSSPLLFFISALKGEDFRSWMGQDTIRKLEEKGYGTLVKKAAGEFQSIAKQFAEPQPGQWQSLFFPVAVATEVHQMRAFVKRDKKKDSENRPTGEEDTRFILEMDLSQLGELQMDGLVQRKESSLRFDLIVRSHEPLPEHLTKEIEGIFHDTAMLTAYTGRISFQSMMNFPIHPLEETLAPSFNDVLA